MATLGPRPRPQVMRLSEAAAGRIRDIIGKSERPIAGVRVGVQNGGCAGMSYMMEYAEAIDPRDEIVDEKGVRLFIDPKASSIRRRCFSFWARKWTIASINSLPGLSSIIPTRPLLADAGSRWRSRRQRRSSTLRRRPRCGDFARIRLSPMHSERVKKMKALILRSRAQYGVSKDGRESLPRVHPSRRGLRPLLRMR